MTFQVTDPVSRRAARKLLRAKGLSTVDVHRMSYSALASALATHGVDPARFDALVASWRNTPPPWNPATPVPAVPAPVPVSEALAVPVATGTIDAAVAALVAQFAPKAPVLDPAAIAEMVDAAVAKAVSDRLPQTLRVEYKGEIREVSGIRHPAFDEVLQGLVAKQNVWLPGPAGSGKSTLAIQAGQALGYTLAEPTDAFDAPMRIYVQQAVETSFGYLGYKSPHGDASTLMTALRRAWEFGGLLVLDDTDRSSAKALAALNMPLANGLCQFPDALVKRHPACLIVATANTYGLGGGADYVGAGRLDKATLDRFVYIDVPYCERSERLIANGIDSERGPDWVARVQAVRSAVRRLGIKHLVTPRATYKGLALMAAGMKQDRVEAAVLFAGLDDESARRVRGAL